MPIRTAFPGLRLITVYNTPRAFTIRKDVLPTSYLSRLTYLFECRQCASRYVGRTLQYLNARVRQHVPLHLLPQSAKTSRPKRGRPRKLILNGETLLQQAKSTPRLQGRPRKKVKSADDTTQRRSQRLLKQVVPEKDVQREYPSPIANHIYCNVDCVNVYSDDCFSPLSRGRSSFHLDVLESIYVKTLKPSLCTQKTNIVELHLFTSTLT